MTDKADPPDNVIPFPTLEVPPHLKMFTSPIGVHRRGIKVMVFGPPDAGKSFFLAHMPSPKVVIDANEEGGIQTYLRPEDTYFNMSNPETILSAIDFVLANESKLASFCIDGMSGMWEETMDYWARKLGGEIQGGDWRKVKGPWKLLLKRLMRSKLNIGFSAWLKDVGYEQVDQGGIKKLEIKSVDVPQAEKTIAYTVDFILKADTVLDKKKVPTQYRTLTVYKARRPRSISSTELFSGKQWKFDQKQPVDPWQIVIEPFIQQWQEGAVDYLGCDPMEEQYEGRAMEDIAQDNSLARILQLIAAQTDLQTYARVWAKEIDPDLRGMSASRITLVADAHKRKKLELEYK